VTTHPLDLFEKTFIINLASRADRRVEMQEQLLRIGLSLQSPRVQLFEAVRPEGAGEFPSVGARGCFLSHLEVLRQAVSQDLNSILIIEDDVNFSIDFPQRGAEVLSVLAKQDWAMFYGGYELQSSTSGHSLETGGCSLLSHDERVQTAHFVAFRGRAIPQAMDYLSAILDRPQGSPEGGPMHVDGAYFRFRKAHPQLRTYIAVPEIGYQRASRSDIFALQWHDRLPVVNRAVGLVRRIKNRLLMK
jgi:glycosyl transferase, family 25